MFEIHMHLVFGPFEILSAMCCLAFCTSLHIFVHVVFLVLRLHMNSEETIGV